jgi:hypothetical protein
MEYAGKALPQEEAGEDAGEITTNRVSLIRFLEERDRKYGRILLENRDNKRDTIRNRSQWVFREFF